MLPVTVAPSKGHKNITDLHMLVWRVVMQKVVQQNRAVHLKRHNTCAVHYWKIQNGHRESADGHHQKVQRTS